MHPTTRQRVIVTAILLAIALLMVAAGVALALAESRHLVAGLISTMLAFAVFVVVLRTDTGLLVRSLNGLRLLLPIVAFSLTTVLMSKTAGTVRFDEVGAQVIIVLLLALAIDARFFRLRAGSDRLDVNAVLFTMLLLAVGEYYALRGLLGGRPANAETIAGAIAAGFTAVAVTAMTGTEASKDRDYSR